MTKKQLIEKLTDLPDDQVVMLVWGESETLAQIKEVEIHEGGTDTHFAVLVGAWPFESAD